MLVYVHGEPRVTRDDLGRLTRVSAAEGIPPPERVWSDRDWLLIQRGHKSAEMDDRWDAFVEGQRLYLHRSWTGHGIYEAEFGRTPDGWQISSAIVEGDGSIYRRQDDSYESASLEGLINGTLLGVYQGPGR
jgi:hypothetical protein